MDLQSTNYISDRAYTGGRPASGSGSEGRETSRRRAERSGERTRRRTRERMGEKGQGADYIVALWLQLRRAVPRCDVMRFALRCTMPHCGPGSANRAVRGKTSNFSWQFLVSKAPDGDTTVTNVTVPTATITPPRHPVCRPATQPALPLFQ